MRVWIDAVLRQVLGEVGRLRLRVERPHQRQVACRKDRSRLADYLIRLNRLAPDPPDVVRPGNREVRLDGGAVSRRDYDLDPRRRLLPVVVGEVDERLRYCRHDRIVARARPLGRHQGRRGCAWHRAARSCGGVRSQPGVVASHPRRRRLGGRAGRDRRFWAPVCLAPWSRRHSRLAGKPPLSNHGVPMDSLHAIGFYVSAAISVGGGLLVAFLPGRGWRGLALAVAGLGIAGLYASLSADFAGLVALVSYAGCALLIAGPRYRIVDSPGAGDQQRTAGV